MGPAGAVYLFLWGIIGVIDGIFILMYEFTHLPNKDSVDFDAQKKLSLGYFLFAVIVFVYFLIISILYFSVNSKTDVNLEGILIVSIFLILFDLLHYVTAHNFRPISRKIAIITTLATLTMFVSLFFSVPYSIKSYNSMKTKHAISTTNNSQELQACLEIQQSEINCKKTLAIQNNDESLCLSISDTKELNLCLYGLAKNTKNIVFCDKIVGERGINKAKCRDLLKK